MSPMEEVTWSYGWVLVHVVLMAFVWHRGWNAYSFVPSGVCWLGFWGIALVMSWAGIPQGISPKTFIGNSSKLLLPLLGWLSAACLAAMLWFKPPAEKKSQ